MMLILFELFLCLEDRWVVTAEMFVMISLGVHKLHAKVSQVCRWEEDNRQEGQSSGMTIVREDKCQRDICQGGHLSQMLFFKLWRLGFHWKDNDA